MGSPTKSENLPGRLASEMRHVLLQHENFQILEQTSNADCCREVQNWNYPVLHHDHVQRHLDPETRKRPDRGFRVQVVVTNIRNLMRMADFALLALVEVEAAAGKKNLLPCRVLLLRLSCFGRVKTVRPNEINTCEKDERV